MKSDGSDDAFTRGKESSEVVALQNPRVEVIQSLDGDHGSNSIKVTGICNPLELGQDQEVHDDGTDGEGKWRQSPVERYSGPWQLARRLAVRTRTLGRW